MLRGRRGGGGGGAGDVRGWRGLMTGWGECDACNRRNTATTQAQADAHVTHLLCWIQT